MLYTIVEPFGPESGESWSAYIRWRGIPFSRFDSIDGILRPNLFTDPRDEDWQYIVNENFMLHLITDQDYAEKNNNK